jgi:hypothetical protein
MRATTSVTRAGSAKRASTSTGRPGTKTNGEPRDALSGVEADPPAVGLLEADLGGQHVALVDDHGGGRGAQGALTGDDLGVQDGACGSCPRSGQLDLGAPVPPGEAWARPSSTPSPNTPTDAPAGARPDTGTVSPGVRRGALSVTPETATPAEPTTSPSGAPLEVITGSRTSDAPGATRSRRTCARTTPCAPGAIRPSATSYQPPRSVPVAGTPSRRTLSGSSVVPVGTGRRSTAPSTAVVPPLR